MLMERRAVPRRRRPLGTARALATAVATAIFVLLWRFDGGALEYWHMDIEKVFDDHHDRLMAIPGVTGIGIGSKDGKPAIVIMVRQLTPAVKERLPRSLNGHPVVLEESGEIVAH